MFEVDKLRVNSISILFGYVLELKIEIDKSGCFSVVV